MVGSYVGCSVGIGDVNLEGCLLGEKSLDADGESEKCSSNGSSYGSGDGKLELCSLVEKSLGVDVVS